jgi:hypothetical protein
MINLQKLVTEIRNYPGITRKHIISEMIKYLPHIDTADYKILASYGEDAAVIEYDTTNVLLLAADGIKQDLMEADAFWAGYCAVLVNVNDIVAMGGLPIGMVQVASLSGEPGLAEKVLAGVRTSTDKFGVPLLGGHTHPDCTYNAIDIAILGIAKRQYVIYSDRAAVGDDILLIADLDGRIHPNFKYSWDTTSFKSSVVVKRQISLMQELAERELVTAGKDISNPGTLGTIAMLLETSNRGAIVDLTAIPVPKHLEAIGGINHWLKLYLGYGFIVTANPEDSSKIIQYIEHHRLAAKVIGTVEGGSKFKLTDGKSEAILFDFDIDIVTGIKPQNR